MKVIFVSQRVEFIERYNERRDCLDQKWTRLLSICGCVPVLVPNHTLALKSMLSLFPPDGILLTGGNSPAEYGGGAPERDETDNMLIEYAIENSVPMLGVCRGMQSIIVYFGGALNQIPNHVAARHTVSGEINREVNSYHTLAALSVPSELTVSARADDGAVESIRHNCHNLAGIMWHPERETPFCENDLAMIKRQFKSGG